MALLIQNPTDSFDHVQTTEFHYKSKQSQNGKSTLFIKAVKYKKDSEGIVAYSDEPPMEIFIQDVDAYVSDAASSGDLIPYESFGSSSNLVAHMINKKLGLDIQVQF